MQLFQMMSIKTKRNKIIVIKTGLKVGLGDLRGLMQPQWFSGSRKITCLLFDSLVCMLREKEVTCSHDKV